MPPTAYIAHRLPGRVRIKIPAMSGNDSYFISLAQALHQHAAVRHFKANPLSASVVIEHESTDVDSLLGQVDLFTISPGKKPPSNVIRLAAKALVPGKRTGLKATAAGFTAMAVYQVAKGRYASSAVENYWNAYGAYRTLRQPWTALGLAAVGTYQLVEGRLLSSALSMLFFSLSAKKMTEGEGSAT